VSSTIPQNTGISTPEVGGIFTNDNLANERCKGAYLQILTPSCTQLPRLLAQIGGQQHAQRHKQHFPTKQLVVLPKFSLSLVLQTTELQILC